MQPDTLTCLGKYIIGYGYITLPCVYYCFAMFYFMDFSLVD